MMARSLACLLIPLGLSRVSAQLTIAPVAFSFTVAPVAPEAAAAPDVVAAALVTVAPAPAANPLAGLIPGLDQEAATAVETGCSYDLEKCMTGFAASTGESIAQVCSFFTVFVACYEKHIGECNKENGEALVYEKKFTKIVRRLPSQSKGGCREFAPRLVERKNFFPSSDSSTVESSVMQLPGSGTEGNPSGSSLFYANWWQWLVLLSCVCCCFLAAGGACVSRRRRGNIGYYEDPYSQQQQMQQYPQIQQYNIDPQQVQPLTGYSQGGYNQGASFPVTQGGYNQGASFPVTQGGYNQGGQGYTANMPTQQFY